MNTDSETTPRRTWFRRPTPHARAVAEALFVTLLWSSSYVLVRTGLESIPPLTFAGLRYALAAVLLWPLLLCRGSLSSVRGLSRREWIVIGSLGVTMYALTQGAQFVALVSLRAATVSLALTLTPVVVAIVGVAVLAERPTVRQWVGVAALVVGAGLYVGPVTVGGDGAGTGLAAAAAALGGNAAAALLGRRVNRDGPSPLVVTTLSMTVGGGLLLAVGTTLQGVPVLSHRSWLIVGWLAAVNTAFAFTLWNRTLRTLSAVESSAINNTMLVQVAVLGWLFLGEPLSPTAWVGLLLAAAGAFAVQRR
ncbi:DMT family transporter [Haloprofundus salinisoli]|uniref:DMT family transporter n=1 Tax=Haloprofundus salinisoli TaxID=2876193 RepID=UPI001CCBA820|nr:EamA family transporter [Haloprofundus salinisoli]